MEEEKSSGIKRFFASGKLKGKGKTIIVAVLAAIVILIFFSTLFPSQKEEKNSTSFDELCSSFKSLEYCSELENRLEKVLVKVKDIGEVGVFVMVESSPTFKYVEEVDETQSDSQTSKRTTIYETRNGSITSPVVELEILPKIVGVLIVATGAKDTKMKVMLTNIAATILSVDISKVEVLEGR